MRSGGEAQGGGGKDEQTPAAVQRRRSPDGLSGEERVVTSVRERLEVVIMKVINVFMRVIYEIYEIYELQVTLKMWYEVIFSSFYWISQTDQRDLDWLGRTTVRSTVHPTVASNRLTQHICTTIVSLAPFPPTFLIDQHQSDYINGSGMTGRTLGRP